MSRDRLKKYVRKLYEDYAIRAKNREKNQHWAFVPTAWRAVKLLTNDCDVRKYLRYNCRICVLDGVETDIVLKRCDDGARRLDSPCVQVKLCGRFLTTRFGLSRLKI